MNTVVSEDGSKTVLSAMPAPGRHWVGDGFPVQGLFGYSGAGVAARSPFLMLDYAAPWQFAPSRQRRGVGAHPHRGFETVTIVWQGEIEHRDSSGAGGVIGPGDVQWMTAGSGVMHDEFHSDAYAARGGAFHVAQIWVNLPARHKMTAPHYQAITKADIPSVALPGSAGEVRVIAGSFNGSRGPAETFTPMNVLDVRVAAGAVMDLAQPAGWNTLVVVLEGSVRVNGTEAASGPVTLTLSNEGAGLEVEVPGAAHLLVLAGEPVPEPVVGYGPFVMNSMGEIEAAIQDFNRGRFGRLDGEDK